MIILFNFKSLMTMLISKQHNIKFIIIIKISDIKFVLFYLFSKAMS